MIVSYVSPEPAAPPNPIGRSLSRLAYPLDCRTPEPLAKLVEKLDDR